MSTLDKLSQILNQKDPYEGMDIEEKKLTKLLEAIKATNDGLTKEEFTGAFDEVLKFTEGLAKTNSEEFKAIKEAFDVFSEKLKEESTSDREEIRSEVRKEAEKMMAEMTSNLNFMRDKMKTHLKGLDGKNGKDGESIQGPPGRDGSPDSPEQIANKLESLQGDARLDVSAIKGLDDLEQIRTGANRVQTPAKSYQVHKADVSSQCDGVTKTFTVGGSHVGIMGVYSTEFPIIYRPVIDYTETRTGILLTDAVSAPASGQTVIIQYLK